MRLTLIAIALLLPLTSSGQVKLGVAACPPSVDFGSTAWVSLPEATSCASTPGSCASGSAVNRWTFERIAAQGRVAVIVGSDEAGFGLSGTIIPELKGNTASAFDLHFADSRPVMNWTDLVTWVAALKATPGWQGKVYYGRRYDLVSRHEASRSGSMAPALDWFLETPRTLSTFAAAFRDNGEFAENDADCETSTGVYNDCGLSLCRVFNESSIDAGELYGDATTSNCGATYTGSGDGERGARLYDILGGIDAALDEDAVYYIQRPGSSSSLVFGAGYHVLANMIDTDYQTAAVEMCRLAVAAGFDGCQLPHKNHYYWNGNTGAVEWWAPISGDGLGGDINLTGALVPGMYNAETIFSGPPYLPDGVTPFDWELRSRGDVEFARLHDTAGLNTFVNVNPNYFEGCPHDPATWDRTYGDTGCDDDMDDPVSAANEADQIREYILRADACVVSLGDDLPTDASIGSGATGSGFTFYEFRDMLRAFPSPDGTPCEVFGWSDHPAVTNGDRATPPVLCSSPTETNPDPVATCGNSTIEPGEECDDGNTTGGDGCDAKCREPWAVVVAGQSNAEGRSTLNDDNLIQPPAVTSVDSLTGLISRVYRSRYDFDSSGSFPTWVKANSWPCATDQCTELVGGACATRTKANNASLDTDCPCDCGTTINTDADDENLSAWPTFAQRVMQDTGREVEIVSVNRGATALVAADGVPSANEPLWDPDTDCSGVTYAAPLTSSNNYNQAHGMYCLLFHAVTQSGVGNKLKAVLWYQGEDDATALSGASITKAQYKAALNMLVDNIWAELGVPTIIATLSLCEFPADACSTKTEGGSGDHVAQIRNAQLEVIDENAHAYRGPDTNDLEHVDSVHVQDVVTLGQRWADAFRTMRNSQVYDGGAAGAPPAETVVAAFTATPMQGTTCVAPCVVHFDATATTADDYSREFHTLSYRWDFDDPGSGTWTTGSSVGASRDAAEGAIQGHVYYAAGTYTVALTVTAPDGASDIATANITVTNPDTLTTYCVSTSGTYTGCTGTGITTSNFNTALTSAGATSGKVRVRFRGGEVFDSSTSSVLSTASGAGLIDSYGTGQASITKSSPETSSTSPLATVSCGWTIYNIETDVGIQASSTWVNPSTIDSSCGSAVIGTTCLNNGNYCVSTNGVADGGSPYHFAFVDNTTTALSDPDGTNFCNSNGGTCTPSTGGTCIGGTLDGQACGPLGSGDPGAAFMRHNNIVVMGNSLTSPEYLTRTVHVNKAVFAHNTYSTNNTTGTQNNFQLRSCDSTGVTCGGITQRSRWVWIADNLFKQTLAGNFPAIRISDNSTAASSGTGDGGISDIVIERNFMVVDGSYGDTGVGGLVGYQVGVDVTVRNNVVDYQGAAGTGTMRFINPASSTGITQDRVQVYNNTLYVDDTSTGGVTFCDGGSTVATSTCSGNLMRAPNRSGTKQFSSGAGWATVSDNVNATTDPFIATPPAQGSSVIDDFAVDVGSQADGAGYDFTGSTAIFNMLDAAGCLRSDPWDAGAWQIFGTGCLEGASLVGINSEKIDEDEQALPFADMVNNSTYAATTADPSTSTWETFHEERTAANLAVSSGVTIPANELGYPSVTVPSSGAVPCYRLMESTESGTYPTGTYTLVFEGTGEIVARGDGSATCTGTDQSCSVSITPSSGMELCITDSDISSDPITRMRLLAPGYTTSDTYYWPFVHRLRRFGFMRMMNAMFTNHYPCSNLAHAGTNAQDPSCTHTWVGRTDPDGIQSTRRGMAWEHQIGILNAAGIGMWGHFPHAATDEYVTEAATMVRDNLHRNVIWENTSEPWGGFDQGLYYRNVGLAAGFDCDGGTCTAGTPDTCTGGADNGTVCGPDALGLPRIRAYVNRASEIRDLVDAVFTGDDASRSRMLLNSSMLGAETDDVIYAMNSGTFNPTSAPFDAIAINTYIGPSPMRAECIDGTCVANVCSTFGDPEDDGDSCAIDGDDLLDETEADLATDSAGAWTTQRGKIWAEDLELWTYEGNVAIEGTTTNELDAVASDRLDGIVQDYYDEWFGLGGTITGGGFYCRSIQNWGMMRTMKPNLDDAPKYRGVRNAIRAAPSSP